ncbi:MAG: flagellar hook-length control protein FliK [Acidimicrobiales bacterium]|nr:flagellar hook-length control protein FliK [Acidimicrobiales bacterium]
MQIMSLVAPTPPSDDAQPRSETDVDPETGESDFMAILAGALAALGRRDAAGTEEGSQQTEDGEVAAALVEVEVESGADDTAEVLVTEVPAELAADAGAANAEAVEGEPAAADAEAAEGEAVEGEPAAADVEAAEGEVVEREFAAAGAQLEDGASDGEASVVDGADTVTTPDAEGATTETAPELDAEVAGTGAAAPDAAGGPLGEEAGAAGSAELDGVSALQTPAPAQVAGAEAEANSEGSSRSATRAVLDTTTAPSASAPAPDAAASAKAPTTVAEAMFDAELDSLEGDDPWQQVARVVRPLRQLADGSHRIALALRPAELGSVHLEVALEDGRLTMRAVTETVAAREALVGALPELRAELTRSGVGIGSLDVGEDTMAGDGADDGSGGDETTGRASRGRADTDGALGAPPTIASGPQPTPIVAAGRLDLTL